VEVQTLDNRKLRVTVNEVVNPNTKQVLRGEGMPLPKNPSQRGDLIINFNVAFPTSLSPQQKQQLAAALP